MMCAARRSGRIQRDAREAASAVAEHRLKDAELAMHDERSLQRAMPRLSGAHTTGCGRGTCVEPATTAAVALSGDAQPRQLAVRTHRRTARGLSGCPSWSFARGPDAIVGLMTCSIWGLLDHS